MKLIPETPQEDELAHRRLLAIEYLLGPVEVQPLPSGGGGGGGAESRETHECN